jgi:predicted transcriptional regulator
MKRKPRIETHEDIHKAIVDAAEPITAKEIAGIVGVSAHTVREHIIELRRERKIKSTPSPRKGGGWGYAHEALEGQAPLLSVEALSEMSQLMFYTVSRMDKPVSAKQVARKTRRHIDAARAYLADLVRQGFLGRDKAYERPGGRWVYKYFAIVNVEGEPEDEADAWFLGEGFKEAIEAAKPSWRDGEQFTRKEVADWREVNVKRWR